ncbi:MAG: hypothetical protein IKW19_05265 [Akkermansia sp.]|jgi:hypothetical protein|nr:hypothetical protein [Akkermansia sp.]MBR5886962.1 hypothetical protein [Akkermansia sp.]
MSEERIRKQLVDLDFPNLCRLIVTAEVHPRCIALCNDGKEYAVTIHEKLCNRAKVYYHGSKAVCIEAYKSLVKVFTQPDSEQCTHS